MLRKSLLGAALAALISHAAQAETVAQSFESFGLLGTWAPDCKKPASENNLYMKFSAMPSGHVRRELYDGPAVTTTYVVNSAEVTGDLILFQIYDLDIPHREYDLGPFDRNYQVEIKKKGDEIRLWTVYHEYRLFSIRYGQGIDTHVETPWQSKCR
jgi:hypothetical protein